ERRGPRRGDRRARGARDIGVSRRTPARVPRGKASNRRNLLGQRCGNDPARRNRLAERRNGSSRDEMAGPGGEISLRTAATAQIRDRNAQLRDRAILRRGPEATIGDQTSQPRDRVAKPRDRTLKLRDGTPRMGTKMSNFGTVEEIQGGSARLA